jgi:nucleotidyltransferase substrate binding protein (TIGR01987 family)
MKTDIRWRQRLNSFHQSIDNLDVVHNRARDHELDRVELQALIKSFELSYETGWNLMKVWLEYHGTPGITGSRDAIRKAFNVGLLSDGSIWMEMLQTRNRTAYTYNESVAREVAQQILEKYYSALHDLLDTMDTRASSENGGIDEVYDIPGLSGDDNKAIRSVFGGYPAVQHVFLYGSRVKGTHRAGSDIDLCILDGDVDTELISNCRTSSI